MVIKLVDSSVDKAKVTAHRVPPFQRRLAAAATSATINSHHGQMNQQRGINFNEDWLRLEFPGGATLTASHPCQFESEANNMALNQEALNSLRIEREAEPSPTPRSYKKPMIIIVITLIVAAAVIGWKMANGAIEVEAVDAMSVQTGGSNSASVLDASGYVVARRIATVSAKMMGQVEQVLIDTGDHVKQGQVLARLDGSTVHKQFDLSTQQLEATRAQLDEVKVRLLDAQRAVKRAEQLRAEKLISEAENDTVHTNLAALQAQLAALQHQVSVSESSVKLQQQNVNDLEVKAPFTGVVVAKSAQQGEIISPMSSGGFTRTGIATIVDMDSLEIEVDVNESFIHRVTDNMKAQAILDAYQDWIIPSHVISIVPTADRAKATVKVRIGFDKLDPRILPDMGVKVRFLENAATTTTVASAVELPASAIVNSDSHKYVWRIVDDKLERVAVSTGAERNGRVAIIAGIHSGDHVVNNPASTLQDGNKVKIKS